MPQKRNEESKKPSFLTRIKQALFGESKENIEPVKVHSQKVVPQKRDNVRPANSEYGSVPVPENKKPSDGYGRVTSNGRASEYFNAQEAKGRALPGRTQVGEYGPLQNATQYSGMPSSANSYGRVPGAAAANPPASANNDAINSQAKEPHLPINVNELDTQFLESHTLPQVRYPNQNRNEMIFLNYNAVLGNMQKAIENQSLAEVAQKLGTPLTITQNRLLSVDVSFKNSAPDKTSSDILSVTLELSDNTTPGKRGNVTSISREFDLNNKNELNDFVNYLNKNAAIPTPNANNVTPSQDGVSAAPPSNYASTPNNSDAAPPSNYARTPVSSDSAPPSHYTVTPKPTTPSNDSTVTNSAQQASLLNAADNYGRIGASAAKTTEKTNYASMPSAAQVSTNGAKNGSTPVVTASLAASLAKILELKVAAKQGKENTAEKAPAVLSTRFDDGAKPSAPTIDSASPPPKPATPPRFLGTEATRAHGASMIAAFEQQKKTNSNSASSTVGKAAAAGEPATEERKSTRPRG